MYRGLGTGHSEIVYHKAMEVELRMRGIMYESKVILPIYYRQLNVGYGEADLIVYDDASSSVGGDVGGLNSEGGDGGEATALKQPLIVELKAVTYAPREAERAQLRSYLRLHGSSIGLLVNFRQATQTTPEPEEPDMEVVEYS